MSTASPADSSMQPAQVRLLQVTTVDLTLEFFLLPFGKRFREQGWRVDALANGARESAEILEAFDHVWEATWTRSPKSPRNFLSAPRVVRDVVAQGNYEVVHFHTPIAAFVGRMALRKIRKEGRLAVIYTAHGFHFHERGSRLTNRIYQLAEQRAGDWTDHLVVLTETDYEKAIELDLIAKDRLHLIEGIGVDTTVYSPDAVPDEDVDRLRRDLEVPDGAPLLLCIARLAEEKRHKDILRSLARLQNSAHLMLAGDGPLEDEIRRTARDLGIEDRVHLLGFRTDMPTVIKASSLTIIASEREGLSRSALESMSMGVPVVGSDIRGVRELITTGEHGILFRPGDIGALTAAIDRLLGSPEEATAMGERCRERAGRYDLQEVLDAYQRLYLDSVSAIRSNSRNG